MEEKTIVTQDRTQSATWWVGMVTVAAQGVCAVLVATGTLTELVAGAVIGACTAVFAYCNGNNPCIHGKY